MSVRPSVRLSRVIFERRKTSFPMFRWRRNLKWTKRQSRTIQKWHKNVGPSVCLSIEDENERKWTTSDDKVVASYEPRGSCFLFLSLCESVYRPGGVVNGYSELKTKLAKVKNLVPSIRFQVVNVSFNSLIIFLSKQNSRQKERSWNVKSHLKNRNR